MATIMFDQVVRVANLLKTLPETPGLNFYSFGDYIANNMYPELNHPNAVEFFFFVCLHQHGFWYGNDRGYEGYLEGMINGKRRKGSDLLWEVCKRALDRDKNVFSPIKLFAISPEKLMQEIFCDDNGPIPFPDIEKRFILTKKYADVFISHDISPKSLLNREEGVRWLATDTGNNLHDFIANLRRVSGFDKDPLHKKSLLLAMALANRPEEFLKINDPENWKPIVDYHLMRTALRLGMVELSNNEKLINTDRIWVSELQENHIRTLVFHAVELLIKQSGKPMSFVDNKLWMARKYCPEMKEPNCEKCIFTDVCEKRTELFQPVFRTLYY